ncbi:2-phospho-L-lactate transferase CofD family protein, partial [Mycolicibacterium elephantis]
MKVTVLVGGVGGARFLLGVQHLLGLGQFGDNTADELTAIVNVGDDAWMFGVRICPDLDTCMYTLG